MCRSQTACLLLAFLLPGVGHAQLLAGAAKSDITPKIDGHQIYLAGFGHNRIATRVHDPLHVRCLALQAGRQIVVLCVADLIGLFLSDVETIRDKFRRGAPASARLIVACTHVTKDPTR